MVSVTRNNTPALRFDGFDGEWRWAKLGDFGRVGMNKRIFKHQTAPTGDIPFYKIGTFGKAPDAFIPQSLYDAYRAKYPHPSVGAVLISASGSIGRTLVYNGQPAYFQDSNIIWLDHNGGLLNSYLEQFYSITDWNGIEGTTIRRLYNEQFLAVPIPVPPAIEEQRAIGELLSDLDALIEHRRDKHANLKQTKTALLQRMFPQDGADEPELRLGGFSGAWEAKPLKNLGSSYGGLTGKTKEDFGHGDARYITYLDVFERALITDASRLGTTDIDNRQNEVKIGDVLFTVSSEVPEEVGMSAVWLGQGRSIYLNSFCFGFRPIAELDSKFLAYVLRSPDFRKKMTLLAQGISRFNISKTRAMELEISFPTLEEQRAIGEVFADLDALIAAERRYITQLVQAKTALLQRMFV
ncbi:restriction endonuclease subunit S [Corynebacterium amycolatum]|nr:restriction endonuclease subunit S [Corynebacterium amycolatum]